jgi:hypothetical protein
MLLRGGVRKGVVEGRSLSPRRDLGGRGEIRETHNPFKD